MRSAMGYGFQGQGQGHVIPHVPVRQSALSLPIPPRVLLSAQPELVTPVLQVVQRVVTRHLPDAAAL
jgi:hypothetical protein